MIFNRQRNRLIENPDIFPQSAAVFSENTKSIAYMKQLLRKAGSICLTPRQRQIVELYYYKGFNMPEIADLLSLNVSTVSRHLKAARSRLIIFSNNITEINQLRHPRS